ncbi:rhodanese-like domain-containing protein [Nannocystaceae bacterium ST9]
MSEPAAPRPPTIHQRIRALDWKERVDRSVGGRPQLDPEFVAELGREARIIDLREPDQLVGVLGHIPGSIPIALAEVAKIAELLPLDARVVLVSSDSERSSRAALYLESLDMNYVAALRGGMRAWKEKGFAISRDPAIFERRLDVEPVREPPGEPIGEGCKLSVEQVAWHVGQPGSVRWLKFAALMMHGKSACIDGRDDHGVIGTPGGDAGEFVLGLAAVEKLAGVALSDERVTNLLVHWVDTFGRFYLHTDTGATNRFIKALRDDPEVVPHLGTVYEAHEWRAFMRRPPADGRELILRHLTPAEHVGCGHLRLSMQHPDRYGVRPELIQSFLRAFFRKRWAGLTELEYVVLGGDHGEGAVVEVVVEGELWPYTRIPLLSPAFEGMQMFVIHPQVSSYLRRQRAAFLAAELTELALDEAALADVICELGQRQLGETASRLAGGLPIVEVRFDRRGEFTVRRKD